MKYALLVFHPKEQFDRPRDSAMAAAGKAYGEALRAAGVVADSQLVPARPVRHRHELTRLCG